VDEQIGSLPPTGSPDPHYEQGVIGHPEFFEDLLAGSIRPNLVDSN
jgi:hypothetical protein